MMIFREAPSIPFMDIRTSGRDEVWGYNLERAY